MRTIPALAIMCAALLVGCTSNGPAPGTSSAGSSPSPSPASTSSPSPGGTACVTSDPSGNCGPYSYRANTNSNGFNTYVGNNCWGDPHCRQTITAYNPGHWSLSAAEPAANTGVRTYPNTSQLFNNWCGSGWGGCGASTDTPISSLSSLSSAYTETMPHDNATIAQAAWDIWLTSDSGHPNEVMVWVDNVNRRSGGATQKASANIAGQVWTLYQYGTGELIWSLGTPGTFARQGSGTVDLLALVRWLQSNGFAASGARIGQIQFGWEICSTGGVSKTFTVSTYNLKSTPA